MPTFQQLERYADTLEQKKRERLQAAQDRLDARIHREFLELRAAQVREQIRQAMAR